MSQAPQAMPQQVVQAPSLSAMAKRISTSDQIDVYREDKVTNITPD